MEQRPTDQSTRDFRRRALRYRRHRLPRYPFWQQLLSWIMMIFAIAVALIALAQCAPM